MRRPGLGEGECVLCDEGKRDVARYGDDASAGDVEGIGALMGDGDGVGDSAQCEGEEI
jgi:hypothetical protein